MGYRSQSIRKYKSNKVAKSEFTYSTHIHPSFCILGSSLNWGIQGCVTQQALSSERSQPRDEHKHTSTRDTEIVQGNSGHGNVFSSKEIGVLWEGETLELRSESSMMKTESQPRGRKGKVFQAEV